MKRKSQKTLSQHPLSWISLFLYFFGLPLTFTYVFYFPFNHRVFHYIAFSELHLPSIFSCRGFLLLTYSVRARETEGERIEKVSNE